MAVKNTEKTVETVETVVDPWDIMCKIRLPRAGKNEEKTVFVSMNGRVFYVPKGKEVEVPRPIYETLMLAEQAKEAEIEFCDSIPNEG